MMYISLHRMLCANYQIVKIQKFFVRFDQILRIFSENFQVLESSFPRLPTVSQTSRKTYMLELVSPSMLSSWQILWGMPAFFQPFSTYDWGLSCTDGEPLTFMKIDDAIVFTAIRLLNGVSLIFIHAKIRVHTRLMTPLAAEHLSTVITADYLWFLCCVCTEENHLLLVGYKHCTVAPTRSAVYHQTEHARCHNLATTTNLVLPQLLLVCDREIKQQRCLTKLE